MDKRGSNWQWSYDTCYLVVMVKCVSLLRYYNYNQ